MNKWFYTNALLFFTLSAVPLALADEADEPDQVVADDAAVAVSPSEPSASDAKVVESVPAPASDDEASQFGAALAKVAQSGASVANPIGPSSRRTAAPAADSRFQPAKFNGIQPGTSTEEDVVAAWGEPAESISTADGAVLTYFTEPFEVVEILIDADDVVAAVKISLGGELEPKTLAKQLSLDEFDAVEVTDDEGTTLGQAFPERGVMFLYAAPKAGLLATEDARRSAVAHVAMGPLDAHAFALRAENRLHGPYEKNIADLKQAIALDPELANAYWLLAEVYLATGQADLADAAAAEACELDPRNAAYQLRRGETLQALGQYDDAVREVRAVLDREDVAPLVKAQSLQAMARLAALGDAEIAHKAISFSNTAIELADRLASSRNVKERRAAKRLLVEAHLAIATEIARQAFGNKVDSVGQWIERASGLAEDFIANDGGSLELRLTVAQQALAALSSFKPTLDPSHWVTEAVESAEQLQAQSDDPLWQHRLRWELGQAYLHALRIEHSRRQATAALRYGELAIENLAEGASSRQAVHAAEQMVGKLYFYLGAVHAVHKQDHAKAVTWYDKAAPLLTAPRPVSELFSPRREGEELVSMGVSYWQVSQQSRAVELTQAGVSLVELAVEDGILAKSALAVPYGNLAAMYQQIGESTNATKYAALARSAGATPTDERARSRTGRSPGSPAAGGAIQTNAQQSRRLPPR